MKHFYAGGAFTHAVTHLSRETLRTYGGLLTSPAQGNDPSRAVEYGMAWAMDNDCFVRYDPAAILKALQKWRDIPGCKFVNAPDVIRKHGPTLTMFWIWQPIILAFGFPVAFTLQNGVSLDTMPFDYADALFIGGDDTFKRSETVREIVREGKRRGLWIHAGRVNGRKRIADCLQLGADSFDGTGYSIEPNRIFEALPQLLAAPPALNNVQLPLLKEVA